MTVTEHQRRTDTSAEIRCQRPSVAARISVALAIALVVGGIVYWHLTVIEPTTMGFDFTWPWRAARALLDGKNPYDVIRPSGPYPLDANFKFTLPAAVVAIPFAWVRPQVAAAAFSAISAALLSYALTAEEWGRLFILVSPPFLVNALSGQWSALLMAAAILPGLKWLWVCKPTVGGAMFVYRPTVRSGVVTLLVVLASLVILPSWPRDWLESVRTDPAQHYIAPVTLLGGPIMLASLTRWRTSEGRMMLILSFAPQALTFYSALPPLLAARTRMESLLLASSSTLAWFGWQWALHGRPIQQSRPVYGGNWILWLCYVPALILVLRRPNEGAVPSIVERGVAWLPGWLRGSAPIQSRA